MSENWHTIYSQQPDLHEVFSNYIDASNEVLNNLLELHSFQGEVVLELACGTGKYTKHIALQAKKLLALDSSKAMLDIARNKCRNINNIKYLNCCAESISLQSKSIDVVFGSWFLGTGAIKQQQKSIVKEIDRVLKKNGDVFLIENALTGEFMQMRGFFYTNPNVHPLVTLGFEIASLIKTNIIFDTLEDARKILGACIGKKAVNHLEKTKNTKIQHEIVILHKKKSGENSPDHGLK